MRSFHKYLIVALFSSFSASALAHSPPSLVKQQQLSAHATRASGGYRDINSRFGNVPGRSPRVMREGDGYRGILGRFASATSSRRVGANASSPGSRQ
jgi:hypothetical protein